MHTIFSNGIYSSHYSFNSLNDKWWILCFDLLFVFSFPSFLLQLQQVLGGKTNVLSFQISDMPELIVMLVSSFLALSVCTAVLLTDSSGLKSLTCMRQRPDSATDWAACAVARTTPACASKRWSVYVVGDFIMLGLQFCRAGGSGLQPCSF